MDEDDGEFNGVQIVDTPRKVAARTLGLEAATSTASGGGPSQPPGQRPQPGGAEFLGANLGDSGDPNNGLVDNGFLQQLFQGLGNVLVTGLQARTTEATSSTKAIRDVVRSAIKPLDTTAADMSQALKAFFKPIEAYFNMSNCGDMNDMEQDKGRVLLLESVMGNKCTAALVDLEPEQKKTYAQIKAAIMKHYETQYDPVHALGQVRNAVMRADETSKQFVTRLWGLVYHLRIFVRCPHSGNR